MYIKSTYQHLSQLTLLLYTKYINNIHTRTYYATHGVKTHIRRVIYTGPSCLKTIFYFLWRPTSACIRWLSRPPHSRIPIHVYVWARRVTTWGARMYTKNKKLLYYTRVYAIRVYYDCTVYRETGWRLFTIDVRTTSGSDVSVPHYIRTRSTDDRIDSAGKSKHEQYVCKTNNDY